MNKYFVEADNKEFTFVEKSDEKAIGYATWKWGSALRELGRALNVGEAKYPGYKFLILKDSGGKRII